jgi:hypothetical protein
MALEHPLFCHECSAAHVEPAACTGEPAACTGDISHGARGSQIAPPTRSASGVSMFALEVILASQAVGLKRGRKDGKNVRKMGSMITRHAL